MIRYAYNAQKEPPAPFILVTLRHPYSGAELSDVPAQLDTGADQSLVPLAMAQALSLLHTGEVEVGGVGGAFKFMERYGVLIAIHTFPPRLVEVLSHPGEPWVLLGRDVLNHHRLILDGPRLALEIG
ncbi:MAG: hypothetical protein JNM56_40095 [Planctomycetia bacterium]|nr:hypothetical protein [Planctomycetia bacterium]